MPDAPKTVTPGSDDAMRLLRVARTLITEESAWTKGAYSMPDGRRCAIGALRAATDWRPRRQMEKWRAHRCLLDVAQASGYPSVERMNDQVSHADMLAAFDAAIALAATRSTSGRA
ncbi:MAG: hypothetical protein INR62_01405 [Rhodospirillales bacterium]|nr:hypothetical protein [Acetobacter sp.]